MPAGLLFFSHRQQILLLVLSEIFLVLINLILAETIRKPWVL